ncbi:beta-lactamase family protein [Pendulispora brunnea]|uniref:Beta-lactamase family protein n=1 Tax=Pendulispora brunnea TaxID=2905690 RepID=A0ABZ2KC20_9BACT
MARLLPYAPASMKLRLLLVLLASHAAACHTPKTDPDSASQSTRSTVAQTSAPLPAQPFDVAAVDTYIAEQVVAQGFVGLSIAVVRDGAVILDKGYGHSQLAPDVPVKAETPFAIASLSKQFIAALVLILADEKKLSIEDKVAKYFPDLTRANDITLYDLMTHVSGYHDSYPMDFVDQEMKQPVAPDDAIARYAKRPLDFEPRTQWSYSNTGFAILGRVIEKVTGRALDVVLNERIFRPLGMAHSSYLPTPESPGLAHGYTSFALSPPEPAMPEARGWSFGQGGIYAPAGDIAKWDIALMSGKVLGPDAYKIFTTARRLVDGRPTTYGCGIGVIVNNRGETILRHRGSYSGFVSYSVLVPRTRSAVVAISNRDDKQTVGIVNEIVARLDKAHRPPELTIAGPSAQDVAKDMFAQIQSGKLDRSRFGADFNAFLTDAKLQAASVRLRPLGTPTAVAVTETYERGAMEVATVRFTFNSVKLEATMFRSTDGRVQQFLINKE